MNLIWVIIAIVVISTVVGAVAKMLNNLNEMNANAGRNRPAGGPADDGGARAGGGGGGGAARQPSSDMDRFLAEIDRLRKKAAEAPPPPPNQAPAAPVVQPEKRPDRQDRPRPRVVAEVAELPKQDLGFAAPPVPTVAPVQKPGELPVATVLAPPSTTGGPATRVTRFAGRARPVAKTPFAKNLTSLLATSQGLALAIVLQEILGPPRSKK